MRSLYVSKLIKANSGQFSKYASAVSFRPNSKLLTKVVFSYARDLTAENHDVVKVARTHFYKNDAITLHYKLVVDRACIKTSSVLISNMV